MDIMDDDVVEEEEAMGIVCVMGFEGEGVSAVVVVVLERGITLAADLMRSTRQRPMHLSFMQ